jgi:class 3 adenylate cyclase
MFYPGAIDAATMVSTLLSMQDAIAETCQVRIGLGAHFGEFYYIGGGLYGFEADAIEAITENDTEGGEIVISQAIYDRLPAGHGFKVEKRGDLDTNIGTIYRVVDGPRVNGSQPHDQRYPIPYSEEFYADLVAFEHRLHDENFARQLVDKYLRHKVVVLIDRESVDAEMHEITVFNQLSLSALMKDIGLRLLPGAAAAEIKVVGTLGIYVFDDASAAVGFARTFRAELANYDIPCRIGIDAGPVLIFDLPAGGKDIAGNPVNVASKMAQDKGAFGKLYLSAAMKDLVDMGGYTELNYTVSGVAMSVYEG